MRKLSFKWFKCIRFLLTETNNLRTTGFGILYTPATILWLHCTIPLLHELFHVFLIFFRWFSSLPKKFGFDFELGASLLQYCLIPRSYTQSKECVRNRFFNVSAIKTSKAWHNFCASSRRKYVFLFKHVFSSLSSGGWIFHQISSPAVKEEGRATEKLRVSAILFQCCELVLNSS